MQKGTPIAQGKILYQEAGNKFIAFECAAIVLWRSMRAAGENMMVMLKEAVVTLLIAHRKASRYQIGGGFDFMSL